MAKQVTEIEASTLESELVNDPENLGKLIRMSDVQLKMDKRSKSMQFLRRAMGVFHKSPSSISDGMRIADLGLEYWKTGRYVTKDSLRINISSERSRVLSDVLKILEIIKGYEDPALHQLILFKIACVQESVGMFQEAISGFSDLIAIQAMDGVDLTFIIMKAAVLLKHLGNHDQAIEYLEFLLDDPPESEGYGKTHILAFLALVYDQHPKRQDYIVVIRKTYEDLLESYGQDLAKGKKPLTNQKKIEKMLGGKSLGQSSEIWEMLSLQAVDRCQYVFAFELMQQAVDKAPKKYKLLHILSEVSLLIGYTDRATHYAERAFEIQPQSTELRNLLLTVAPAKWQDKLRNVATSMTQNKKLNDDFGDRQMQKIDDGEEESSWFSNLKANGPSSLFTGGLSPEQKAKKEKIASEKDRRKKEKYARKEKKEAAIAVEMGSKHRHF